MLFSDLFVTKIKTPGYGLNPCCNGCCSLTETDSFVSVNLAFVLILVVMDAVL